MRISPGIFVVGTDTEVGKTLISAGLVLALRSRGQDAGYVKAVSSDGVEEAGRLVSPDARLVRELAGLDDPWAVLNPVCLPHPLSPLAAARREGRTLSWSAVQAALEPVLSARPFLVWEGVGGVLAPLCEGRVALDLTVWLGLPVLVVAWAGLGTINHTLLTIQALRERGLAVLGFCFSGPPPGGPGPREIQENADLIVEFSGAAFLGRVPWLEAVRPGVLLSSLELHLDLEPVLALA